jgi:hypothetical protein
MILGNRGPNTPPNHQGRDWRSFVGMGEERGTALTMAPIDSNTVL